MANTVRGHLKENIPDYNVTGWTLGNAVYLRIPFGTDGTAKSVLKELVK